MTSDFTSRIGSLSQRSGIIGEHSVSKDLAINAIVSREFELLQSIHRRFCNLCIGAKKPIFMRSAA